MVAKRGRKKNLIFGRSAESVGHRPGLVVGLFVCLFCFFFGSFSDRTRLNPLGNGTGPRQQCRCGLVGLLDFPVCVTLCVCVCVCVCVDLISPDRIGQSLVGGKSASTLEPQREANEEEEEEGEEEEEETKTKRRRSMKKTTKQTSGAAFCYFCWNNWEIESRGGGGGGGGSVAVRLRFGGGSVAVADRGSGGTGRVEAGLGCGQSSASGRSFSEPPRRLLHQRRIASSSSR